MYCTAWKSWLSFGTSDIFDHSSEWQPEGKVSVISWKSMLFFPLPPHHRLTDEHLWTKLSKNAGLTILPKTHADHRLPLQDFTPVLLMGHFFFKSSNSPLITSIFYLSPLQQHPTKLPLLLQIVLCWHKTNFVSSVIGKKLDAAAKKKDCAVLGRWKRAILSHLYWCV